MECTQELFRGVVALASYPIEGADPTEIAGHCARNAVSAFVGCDSATVSVLRDGLVTTTSSTDEHAQRVDALQNTLQEGPYPSAVNLGVSVQSQDLGADDRWPQLAAFALGEGIGSCLSLPLKVGAETIGVLTLYSRESESLLPLDTELGGSFAVVAGALVENVDLYSAMVVLLAQTNAAREKRTTVETAAGILMGRDGASYDEAVATLVDHAKSGDRTVEEVATALTSP